MSARTEKTRQNECTENFISSEGEGYGEGEGVGEEQCQQPG